ncbi:MAG: hypothetical protein P8Z30_08585 [Acidobacteriota bacterium]
MKIKESRNKAGYVVENNRKAKKQTGNKPENKPKTDPSPPTLFASRWLAFFASVSNHEPYAEIPETLDHNRTSLPE